MNQKSSLREVPHVVSGALTANKRERWRAVVADLPISGPHFLLALSAPLPDIQRRISVRQSRSRPNLGDATSDAAHRAYRGARYLLFGGCLCLGRRADEAQDFPRVPIGGQTTVRP
jgi:hypothetical protein